MTAPTRTEKVNAVYCVANALNGGLRTERSKREIKQLTGNVQTYSLNKPMTYEMFETLPEDLQREYLGKLYWDYQGTAQRIADMLGVTYRKANALLFDNRVRKRPRGEKTNRKVWEAFLRGHALVKDLIPEESVKQLTELAKSLPVEPLKEAEPEELPKQVETPTVEEAQAEEKAAPQAVEIPTERENEAGAEAQKEETQPTLTAAQAIASAIMSLGGTGAKLHIEITL